MSESCHLPVLTDSYAGAPGIMKGVIISTHLLTVLIKSCITELPNRNIPNRGT